VSTACRTKQGSRTGRPLPRSSSPAQPVPSSTVERRVRSARSSAFSRKQGAPCRTPLTDPETREFREQVCPRLAAQTRNARSGRRWPCMDGAMPEPCSVMKALSCPGRPVCLAGRALRGRADLQAHTRSQILLASRSVRQRPVARALVSGKRATPGRRSRRRPCRRTTPVALLATSRTRTRVPVQSRIRVSGYSARCSC
jgi:hypothetical protein